MILYIYDRVSHIYRLVKDYLPLYENNHPPQYMEGVGSRVGGVWVNM